MASPLVEQFRKGGVSRDIRLTAAGGLLPLKPEDQVELLFLLTRDRDNEVRRKADASLSAVSKDDLKAVLTDHSTSPKVLHFFGTRLQSPTELQLIVQNPSTEDLTVREIVPRLPADRIEFVVVNQTRLLRDSAIIRALEAHSGLTNDQRRRLAELRHDFKIRELAPSASAREEVEVLLDLNEGPPEDELPPATSLEEARRIYGDEHDGTELAAGDAEKKLTAFQKLVRMTPADKLVEALKGDREMRLLLVRDRNRMVYSAVLSNQRLTEGEIEAIAGMKNVSPEVLRILGGKKDWTKHYGVRHELVKNPLTPVEISMKLIGNLSSRDIKRLTTNRNVPDVIRRQANKLARSTQ